MNYEGVKQYLLNRLAKGLPQNLYYHGIEHTLDVLSASEMYSEMEGFTEIDKIYLFTAAVFHDAGYLIRYTKNEDASAAIANLVLPKYGYDKESIVYINEVIRTTQMPQHPFDRVSAVLCDSDLDYLGRDDYFIKAANLRKELDEYGIHYSLEDWYELEIDFLKKHNYFTRSAYNLRNEKKLANLDMVIKLLEKLQV